MEKKYFVIVHVETSEIMGVCKKEYEATETLEKLIEKYEETTDGGFPMDSPAYELMGSLNSPAPKKPTYRIEMMDSVQIFNGLLLQLKS